MVHNIRTFEVTENETYQNLALLKGENAFQFLLAQNVTLTVNDTKAGVVEPGDAHDWRDDWGQFFFPMDAQHDHLEAQFIGDAGLVITCVANNLEG